MKIVMERTDAVVSAGKTLVGRITIDDETWDLEKLDITQEIAILCRLLLNREPTEMELDLLQVKVTTFGIEVVCTVNGDNVKNQKTSDWDKYVSGLRARMRILSKDYADC